MARFIGATFVLATLVFSAAPAFASTGALHSTTTPDQKILLAGCGCGGGGGGGNEDILDDLLGDVGGALGGLLNELGGVLHGLI